MSSELIDVYDENMSKIGVAERSEAHATGAWHRSIHCWVFRPSEPGHILFQKRGSAKKLFPNALDITAAGHYQTGEGPREGVREIFEEIGLDVTLDDLTALGVKFDLAKIGDVVNREFCDVFLLSNDSAPDAYELDPEEVEGLVEIAIPDGLDLFSGRREEVIAAGVELNVADGEWHDIEMSVTVDDFIPRLDAYYKKVFILTDLARKGYRDLAI